MPKHAVPSQPFNSLVGQRLGDLEVIELLAEGATTAVYRARQPALNRQVAVKVLSAEEGRDRRLVERFTQAALAAAAVEHPNIVQVFQAAEDRGHHYVVMELVHGESLARVLQREGRMSAERALPLMKQAAAALAAAHAAGVLHGDIQPSNLLVTAAGQLKVADFSLARTSASGSGPAAASTPPSKPLYFPPEAARGRRLDARSDLYLLGATFYHALAGRPPFEAETAEALALKHIREDPTPLNVAAPKTPLALCHLTQHLLRRNPDERFQKADDLLAAIERIESELEAERRPAPPLPGAEPAPGGELAGRPGLRAAAIAGGVAVIALLILAVIVLGPRGRKPGAAARVATEAPPPPPKPEAKVKTETPAKPPPDKPTTETKVEPKVEPQPPAPPWQKAWDEADAKAKALADVGRFGEAIACYEGAMEGRDEPALRDRVGTAKAALAKAADDAFRNAAARAEQLAAQKQFDAARAELQAIVERAGVAAVVAEARKLLAAIEAQQKAAQAQDAPSREAAERAAALARSREAEASAAKALDPAEALAKRWDFAGAAAEAGKLRLADPEAAARVILRTEELNRLAQLKSRIINHVVTAEPKLTKSSIFIPGLNGPITDADQAGITVSHPLLKKKKPEHYRWEALGGKSARALALAAIGRDRADDWLALGLLEILLGNAAAAEEDFAKARSLKADVTRHVDPLAKAALENVNGLAARRDFRTATAALDALQATYSDTTWLKLHQDDLAAARARVKLGLAESAADALLAQAAECLRKQENYEAKRLLESLQKSHPDSKAVTDATRQPSFAVLMEAVAKLNLGRFLVVRKDGKGDAKSLQEAINAAPPKSLIEVQDSETYPERILIPAAKAGLHLRSKAGCWPVIASETLPGPAGTLLDVAAERTIIEGFVLAHGSAKAFVREGKALMAWAGPLQLRRTIVALSRAPGGAGKALSFENDAAAHCDVQGCLFVGAATFRGNAELRESLFLAGRLRAEPGKFRAENLLLVDGADLNSPADLRLCTVLAPLALRDGPNTLLDCILSNVDSAKPNTQMAHSLLFSAATLGAWPRLDRTSSYGNPQFTDARSFDYRLRPNSPGRNAASDRGELGCRFSAAMLDLLKLALDLRSKGTLAF